MTQYVGYPGFIPLQNAVPMPIATVKAECSLEYCNSFVTYSMKQNEHFFIDSSSGDIFLVNNAGFGSVETTCGQPCSVRVFADLANLNVPQASLNVSIVTLSQNQILVLDSNSSYSAAEGVLSTINSAPGIKGEFWFRLINIQPKEEKSLRQKSISPDKSVLYVTANKLDKNIFVDKKTAARIISGVVIVGVDDTINVNNQPEETSSGGNKTAVIILSVILALVILAVLLAVIFTKRKFFLSFLAKRKAGP